MPTDPLTDAAMELDWLADQDGNDVLISHWCDLHAGQLPRLARQVLELRAEVQRLNSEEPGTIGGMYKAMCGFAEKECGGSSLSSRPPLCFIMDTVSELRAERDKYEMEATIARTERNRNATWIEQERETNRKLRTQLATVEAERDRLRSELQQLRKEAADEARAAAIEQRWCDRNEANNEPYGTY